MAGTTDIAPRIRDASCDDLPAVQAIYAHHVVHGLGSFEEEPPDLDEIERRFRAIGERGLPYLVAELDGAVRGFAYVGPYRPRPAYRFSVETSVYVAPGFEGRGLGRALLEENIVRCETLELRRMVAVIGDSGNLPSIRLHESLGFQMSGVIPSVGFKLGRWVDTVIMDRPLGEGDRTLPADT
ncbi:MAG: N-acetyltransferase family protein [Kiloniellales bacterium]